MGACMHKRACMHTRMPPHATSRHAMQRNATQRHTMHDSDASDAMHAHTHARTYTRMSHMLRMPHMSPTSHTRDFFSDSWVLFADVLQAPDDIKPKIRSLVVPWICLYCIATVVSLVAIAMKIRLFREQVQQRRLQLLLATDEEADTQVAAKLSKHRKRLTKTHRSISAIYSSMCAACA